MEASVIKLVRTSQGRTNRYDLFVRSDAVKRVIRTLRRVEHLAGWHVGVHRCWCERVGTTKGEIRRGPNRPLSTLASWNVCGLASKRADVEWFLHKEKVAILALQETLRSSDEWRLRLAGYECIEAPCVTGNPGARGVALAIAPTSPGTKSARGPTTGFGPRCTTAALQTKPSRGLSVPYTFQHRGAKPETPC